MSAQQQEPHARDEAAAGGITNGENGETVVTPKGVRLGDWRTAAKEDLPVLRWHCPLCDAVLVAAAPSDWREPAQCACGWVQRAWLAR